MPDTQPIKNKYNMSLENIKTVLNDADCIFTESEVEAALNEMATKLDALLADVEAPLFICVMNGGFYTASRLISKVNQPNLQFDYLHVSRYQGEMKGGELVWENTPTISLQGRTVVLIDDIYDEGLTLKEIIASCESQGVEKVIVSVLTQKKHDRNQGNVPLDVVGLEVPDRYVFGCGMDYMSHFRQLNQIYAVKGL